MQSLVHIEKEWLKNIVIYQFNALLTESMDQLLDYETDPFLYINTYCVSYTVKTEW